MYFRINFGGIGAAIVLTLQGPRFCGGGLLLFLAGATHKLFTIYRRWLRNARELANDDFVGTDHTQNTPRLFVEQIQIQKAV